MNRFLALALNGVALLTLAGCGSDGKREISGAVTFDGQPLAQGTIDFVPADGEGPTAAARIAEGKYTLEVQPGKKKVVIHGYRETGQRHAVPDDPNSPLVPILEEIVPARYHSPTELLREITGDGSTVDFEVTSSS
jgi:hypothetical protein